MISERREYARLRLQLKLRYRAVVEHGDPGFWEHGELVDLSLSGACFRGNLPLHEGAKLELMLLPGPDAPELSITAECVRVDTEGMGVRFIDLAESTRARLGLCLASIARTELGGETRKYATRIYPIVPPGRTTEVL